MSEDQIAVAMTVAMAALIAIVLVCLPAQQAYRRGYNPIVWGLAGIFASNPIFVLVVLAASPHRARLRMRQQFREELDRKLAGSGEPPGSPAGGGGRRAELYSVGDQATRMPDRSIGDDQTRL